VPAARVLIVDDSSLARTVIGQAVVQAGFAVAGEATDGIEAVAAYQRLRPDLVTMDLTMPGVDGLTALRSILEFDLAARIVVVSLAGQESTVVRALQAGALGFLLKPFEPGQLMDLLRRTGAIAPAAATDERRRIYLVEAHRKLEALGEDVRDVAATPASRVPIAALQRRAEILAVLASRGGDRSTHSLAESLGRLAAALSPPPPVTPEMSGLMHESILVLQRCLSGFARDDEQSLLAQAYAQRLAAAIAHARRLGEDPSLAVAAIVGVDAFTRRVLRGFLRREGFGVVMCETVDAAHELPAASVVLLDGDAPRFDGPGSIRRLRDAAGTASSALLYLTPRGDLSEKLAAFQAGADDVIVTPFEPEEVVARALAIVGRIGRTPVARPLSTPSEPGLLEEPVTS